MSVAPLRERASAPVHAWPLWPPRPCGFGARSSDGLAASGGRAVSSERRRPSRPQCPWLLPEPASESAARTVSGKVRIARGTQGGFEKYYYQKEDGRLSETISESQGKITSLADERNGNLTFICKSPGQHTAISVLSICAFSIFGR